MKNPNEHTKKEDLIEIIQARIKKYQEDVNFQGKISKSTREATKLPSDLFEKYRVFKATEKL